MRLTALDPSWFTDRDGGHGWACWFNCPVHVLVALTLFALTGCAAGDKPTVRGDRGAGPGPETTSSPFVWRHRCQTECRGCTAAELEEYEAAAEVMCPRSGGAR